MNRRDVLKATMLTLFVCVAGCGPSWQIVRQASPNPLANQHSFVVAPFTFEGLMMGRKSEAEWLATRDARQQASWQNDKANMATRLVEYLNRRKEPNERFEPMPVAVAPVVVVDPAAPPVAAPATAPVAALPPGTFVLQANVRSISGSEMHATLYVRDASGQVIDEVGMTVATKGYGLGSWLLNGTRNLATNILEYVHTRTNH